MANNLAHHAPGATSPSRLARRIKCPASAIREHIAAYYEPDDDSEYAEEGRRKHDNAATLLEIHFCGGSGCAIDGEMTDDVQKYVDWVIGLDPTHISIEEDFEMTCISGTKDFRGAYAVRESAAGVGECRGAVVDFKSGYLKVGESGRSQMMPYAVDTYDKLRAKGLEIAKVDAYIIAPNTDTFVTKYTFDFSEGRRQGFVDQIEKAVKACQRPNAPACPGEHCDSCFCRARTFCGEYLAQQEDHLVGARDLGAHKTLRDSLPTRSGENLFVLNEIVDRAKKAIDKYGPMVKAEIIARAHDPEREDVEGLTVLPNIGDRRWKPTGLEDLKKTARGYKKLRDGKGLVAYWLGEARRTTEKTVTTNPIPALEKEAAKQVAASLEITKKAAGEYVSEALGDFIEKPQVASKPWKIVADDTKRVE